MSIISSFYGTFSGVCEKFQYDITEEYNSIKNTTCYKNNIDKKFKIRNIDISELNFNQKK